MGQSLVLGRAEAFGATIVRSVQPPPVLRDWLADVLTDQPPRPPVPARLNADNLPLGGNDLLAEAGPLRHTREPGPPRERDQGSTDVSAVARIWLGFPNLVDRLAPSEGLRATFHDVDYALLASSGIDAR